MRIVGGRHSGRRLAGPGPGAEALRLRPTSDRVREALFNCLAHGRYPPLEGARALDLFAGVGALGLEALSRGAAHATFIDDAGPARARIRENVEALAAAGSCKIYRRDATRLGANRGAPFTHVFLDPPYGRSLGEKALASALDGGWIAPNAVVVWEEAAEAAFAPPEDPAGALRLTLADRRRYGDTDIAFLLADLPPDLPPDLLAEPQNPPE